MHAHHRALLALLALTTLPHAASAGVEGLSSTFYGQGAGATAPGDTGSNTFVGRLAGSLMTTGFSNTFVGNAAGVDVVGNHNTAIGTLAAPSAENRTTAMGFRAGFNNTASANVFIGYQAGYAETGGNRLYIDNCWTGGNCTLPLIYGEFDNRALRFDGVVHVTADRGAARVKSQLHFSVDGSPVGGYLTSAGDNNFFMSSGASYLADAGGWVQHSADGKAVIAGSGGAGFRVLTSTGGTVNGDIFPVERLHLDYAGHLGLNTPAVAGKAIASGTGAYLSTGGAWINASSRDLKDNIRALSPEDAGRALAALQPVTFNYRAEGSETHVGFIAEEVPDLVATADRKGLGSMDVVAVLTRVVQQQRDLLDRQQAMIAALGERLAALESGRATAP